MTPSLNCMAARARIPAAPAPLARAGLLALVVVMAGIGGNAQAQFLTENVDWVESEAPPPPVFDMNKLLAFTGAVSSSLVYGVDPSTIRITNTDGVVRYVLVATSSSGARNVMYEAIRCSTGEFKTYARYSLDGRWNNVAEPQWRSMFENMPSKHALYMAGAAVCDGAAPVSTVAAMVRRLKNPNLKNSDF